MALMNYARFGSFTDFGHAHFFNNRVNPDIERWGLFNYHYLERNLHAAFTRMATVVGAQHCAERARRWASTSTV